MRFCGRTSELGELIERWRRASNVSAPRPQLVILKAERGVGKTRLALEFYRWLSENVDAKGADGYWPDAAKVLVRSIDVNPDPYSCRYDKDMPFLWWGIRAADPGSENSVAGDAVSSYDRFLAPHLVALTVKARALKSGKALLGVWFDVGKGAAANWSGYDTVMSIGEGLVQTAQILRGTMSQTRATARDQVGKKMVDRADAVLEDLEMVMNPSSITFARTPGVILIDDAQFSVEDPGLSIFCEKLMHMAVTQSWPLMILVTHWKRDLSTKFMKSERSFAGILDHACTGEPGENGPAAGLPGGYLSSENVLEIDLSPVPDLSAALRGALPGLLPVQEQTLIEHAGGNPRHLEQIIAFLGENEDFFEGFDTQNALTEDGLREALEETHDILKVVMRRLRDAPLEVQEAICIASLQGMQFVSGIVNDLAKLCLYGERSDALRKADNPFSMISAHNSSSVAEFSERLFFLVAQKRRRSLKVLGDTEKLTDTLKEILRERIEVIDVDRTKDLNSAAVTFALSAKIFRNSEPVVALNALSSLARVERLRYAHAAAVAAATQYRKLFETILVDEPGIELRGAAAVAGLLSAEGRNDDALAILNPLSSYIKSSAAKDQKIESYVDLCVYLGQIGLVKMHSGEFAAAADIWEQELNIWRFLVAWREDITNLSGLATSLEQIGLLAMKQDDAGAAALAWDEALSIRRRVLKYSPKSIDSLRSLWASLGHIGVAAKARHDLATASQVCQEALQISRELDSRIQTPESSRYLAISLNQFAQVAFAQDDLATAARISHEGLNIFRGLVMRMQTPQSQRDLAISLRYVGRLAETTGDLDTAAHLWEEALALRRELAMRLETPQSLYDLAESLTDTGRSAVAKGDTATAVLVGEEAVMIRRALAMRLQTTGSLRELANSLHYLGAATGLTDDLVAAIEAWRESVDIRRDLAKRNKGPESLHDLCVSIRNLAFLYQEHAETTLAKLLRSEGEMLAKTLPSDMRNAALAAFDELRNRFV